MPYFYHHSVNTGEFPKAEHMCHVYDKIHCAIVFVYLYMYSLMYPCTHTSTVTFSVMSYNVLCDKYATRQQYGYCPSWALAWDYRKSIIMKELLDLTPDIIALQVCKHFNNCIQCIRESVDSLCRDDADMPTPPYIRKAYNHPNAAFVSLFR